LLPAPLIAAARENLVDIEGHNRELPFGIYRPQATFFDGRPDGKILTAAPDYYVFQLLTDAGDN
jgi:hypothetical protein